MCGFFGVINNGLDINFEKEKSLTSSVLNHRGPDDNNFRIFSVLKNQKIFLSHNRLSILDLSSLGRQPMTTSDENFVIIYNGEIYNYLELRKDLKKKFPDLEFKSDTDTEVLLKGWSIYGKKFIDKIKGMFSFAILDKNKKIMSLVRDRFGIKPLYFSINKSKIIFSSEIQSQLKLLDFNEELNFEKIFDYIQWDLRDCDDSTFFKNIKSLKPSEIVEINLNDLSFTHEKYWHQSIQQTNKMSIDKAKQKLQEIFRESVKLHLRSDVKVGVALSGGIDSTSILSMISEIYPDNKIYTFSYISDDKKFSEEKWVDIANEKNNTISKKVEITPNQFERDFESIMEYLGEPFGSASFYSSYRVYKLAAENGIKVILDGQGGDEILGGYFGYLGEKLHSLYKFKKLQCLKIFFSLLINSKYKKLLLREVLKRILLSNMFLSKVFFKLKYKCDNTFSKKFLKKNKIIYDLKKFDLNLENEDSSQRQIIKELRNSITSRGLPSLLRIADRMSMKSSIESRVPFLYEDLIEFMYKLPENFLVSDKGETKFIFRKAMKNILPFEILNRKDKLGFNSPDKKWIVQYLKNNMNSILEELKNFEMLNFFTVKKRIKNLIYKNSDLDPKLWRIINVLVWKKVFKQHIKV